MNCTTTMRGSSRGIPLEIAWRSSNTVELESHLVLELESPGRTLGRLGEVTPSVADLGRGRGGSLVCHSPFGVNK